MIRFSVAPSAAADPPAAADAPAGAADAAGVAPGPRGLQILIVDDNEDAADLLSAILEQLGHATRVAYDAHRALALFDELPPDLAVLDIGLPEIDGYELARRLRGRAGSLPLHLIALTGYGQPSDKERAARAGFDAHFVKPVSIDALQALIATRQPSDRS
jgi:CheY-like chemotaxis protein